MLANRLGYKTYNLACTYLFYIHIFKQLQLKFLWKEELIRLPAKVVTDDDLAAAAADGRPVYCRDIYHRVLAGSQYYKWEDLLKVMKRKTRY